MIVLAMLFVVGVDLGVPTVIAWGWNEWIKSKPVRGIIPLFSFIGFALATLSAMVAIGGFVYGQSQGGFRYYDRRLLSMYRWGCLISATSIVSSIAGVWRLSPLRWFAVYSSVGTLMFWLGAAAGE